MTVSVPATPVCPECGGTNTQVLSDGMAKCWDDLHEWDPKAVTAIPRPQPAPQPVETAADVLGPPADVETEPEPLGVEELIGGTARLEGGQVAQVLSFPDDDHVTVRLNDGSDETIPLGDVERITPRAPEYVVDPDESTADVFAEAQAQAAQIIGVVSATIDDLGEGPLTEVAVTIVISRLMVAYEIDLDDVKEVLVLLAQSEQGDQQQEVPE